MVEKIKRDVRITTIYEGTSEIMEITIGRDRWQEHLKSRGSYYHDRARDVERMNDGTWDAGLQIVAKTYHALAEIMEEARIRRLTRNQHVQMRMGEWIAYAEGAESLARRAIRIASGNGHPKTHLQHSADVLLAMSRINAREVALKVGMEGIRWTGGASGLTQSELKEYEARIGLFDLYAAQNGILEDNEMVREALYRN
jgi:alkylation response protein AidB-like acyl-CoA dehydrogenase